jgi:MFS family permease
MMAEGSRARWYPAYVVGLLFVANLFNLIDRAIIGIVTEPVKHDLALTDTQMSLVSGAAFVLFHLVAGVFIARWADRGNRRNILVLGIAIWSIATGLTGFVQGFGSLALARVFVGVGEATVFPVAMSLIGDFYSSARRPRAVSIFQSSGMLGVVAGSILAGVIAQRHGWRSTFVYLGFSSLAVAALAWLTLRVPERGSNETAGLIPPGLETLRDALATLSRLPGFFMLALGYGLSGMSVAVLPTWAPAFLQRSHGVSLEQVGKLVGPAIGLGAIAGIITSGLIATRLVKASGRPSSGLLVPIWALPMAAPFFAAFLFLPTLWHAIVAVGFANFFLSSTFGPCVALGISIAPLRVRAQGSMVMLLAQSLIGAALAPFVVGVISDQLAPSLGRESLRYALSVIVLAPLVAPLVLMLAFRRISRREAIAEVAPLAPAVR